MDQILEQQPDNIEGYYYRVLVNEKLNHYSQALSDFKNTVELDPTKYTAYVHIDWHYAREQKWDVIIHYWDKYLSLRPEDGRAYLERGGSYYHSGNHLAAKADAKRACDYGNAEGSDRYAAMQNR